MLNRILYHRNKVFTEGNSKVFIEGGLISGAQSTSSCADMTLYTHDTPAEYEFKIVCQKSILVQSRTTNQGPLVANP